MESGAHFISENNMNEFGEILQDWYNSEGFKQMQDAQKQSLEESVGWYHMLPAKDKYKCVEALCHIICTAEQKGTSHRGLMHELGIYPEGFWIDGIMEIHNAMWTEYQSKESENFRSDNV